MRALRHQPDAAARGAEPAGRRRPGAAPRAARLRGRRHQRRRPRRDHQTRCWLEEIALRESIAARTAEWEEALVLAHHRLARTPRSLSEDRFEDNPEWEPLHRAFHRALIGGCGSRWLLELLRAAGGSAPPLPAAVGARAPSRKRGVKGEHQALLEAAVAGDADEAVALLRAHFERTARKIIRDDPGLRSPRRAAASRRPAAPSSATRHPRRRPRHEPASPTPSNPCRDVGRVGAAPRQAQAAGNAFVCLGLSARRHGRPGGAAAGRKAARQVRRERWCSTAGPAPAAASRWTTSSARAPDGLTILQIPSSTDGAVPAHLQEAHLRPGGRLHPGHHAVQLRLSFTAGPGLPAEIKTVADFVKWAKANPSRPATASRPPARRCTSPA